MLMNTLIDLIIKIVIMIAVGIILKKKNIIDDRVQSGLSDILLNVAVPCSLLAAGNAPFSQEIVESLKDAAIMELFYYIGALVITTLISRLLPIEQKAKKVFVTMSTFANVAFIGLPVVQEMFGSEALLCAVVFNLFYDLFFFTYGVYLLSNDGKFQLKSICTNLIAIASVVSILVFLSPFRFPAVLEDTFDTLGSLSTPISMMIIGCNLAVTKPVEILKDKYSYMVSALRLLIFPLVVLVAARFFHLDEMAVSVGVVMTALPAGSMNVILAEKYDCAPQFATRSVVQGMVLMLITLPLVIILI